MTRASSSHVRFSVAEYIRMSDARLFEVFGARRTELLEGRIVKLPPQQTRHMSSMSAIARLLIESTSRNDDVVIQGTLYLPNLASAPEPDFHVFDVSRQTPLEAKPRPFLVIEVSDHTYRRDSGAKLRIYARAGIEDYWIVNIKERRVEVYRDPVAISAHERDAGYKTITHHDATAMVSLLKRPNVAFAVVDMLP